MTNFPDLPPAFIFMLGALLLPLLPGKIKNWFAMAVPVLAFIGIWQLESGSSMSVPFLDQQLVLLKVDKLSKAFGYIFTINGFAAFLYAFYLKNRTQHVSALFYMGSALGVVFAGDLLSLYFYWEIMAISSTFLILARRTRKANGAAFRYVLIHIVGGLILLVGILLTYAKFHRLDFDPALLSPQNPGSWLILVGFLVNAAAPPLWSWLADAYPEATVTGGVILSAYTSKTAVYTLIRGFAGWEILIAVGCVMALYGIIYALLENDMRRILAYSIVNQVGFMVTGIGIGSEMALNGVVAHAFCHIIYKALLWMSAGAVLQQTGKSKCTDLGGLYKTMPLTLILGTIGALSISAVPGTSGFTSKSLIIEGVAAAHWVWAWLVLEIASAGVFLHAGIKFPYFVFFSKDNGLRPKEASPSMLLAMAFLAFFCIFLGFYPQPLYDILPHGAMFQDGTFTVFKAAKLVGQAQLLIFSALVFFLFLPLLKRTDTISLDLDWIYRKGSALIYRLLDRGLNGLNTWVYNFSIRKIVDRAARFFKHGPPRLLVLLVTPWIKLTAGTPEQQRAQRHFLYREIKTDTLPIGITAFMAIIFLFFLFFL